MVASFFQTSKFDDRDQPLSYLFKRFFKDVLLKKPDTIQFISGFEVSVAKLAKKIQGESPQDIVDCLFMKLFDELESRQGTEVFTDQLEWEIEETFECSRGHSIDKLEQKMIITLNVTKSLETSICEYLEETEDYLQCARCSEDVEVTRKIKSLPRALLVFLQEEPQVQGSFPESLDLSRHMTVTGPSTMSLAGFVCSKESDSYFCVMRKGGKWLKFTPGKPIETILDVRKYKPILILYTKNE